MGRYRLVKNVFIVFLLILIVSLVSYIWFYDANEPNIKNSTVSRSQSIATNDVEDDNIEEWERKLQVLYNEYTEQQTSTQPVEKTSEATTLNSITSTVQHNKHVYIATTSQTTTMTSQSINAFLDQSSNDTSYQPSTSTRGTLNVHIWEGWCGSRIEDLKRNLHFPLYPSVRSNLSRFFTQWYETGFGERVFGYLHPPETGNYTFAVSCDDNCEVWLSTNSSPTAIQLIAYVGNIDEPANTKVADFKQYKSQISKLIHLQSNASYYIEVLHKQAAFKDHMLLTWLAPSWPRIKSIGTQYVSSFIDATLNGVDVNDYSKYIPRTKAHNFKVEDQLKTLYWFNHTKYKFASQDNSSADIYPIDYISDEFINDILPEIEYKPSYVVDFIPKRYEGIKLVHETAVYPNDNTQLTHMLLYEDCRNGRIYDSHNTLLQPLIQKPKLQKLDKYNLEFKKNYQFLFQNLKNKSSYYKKTMNKQFKESFLDMKLRKSVKNNLIKNMYKRQEEKLHVTTRKSDDDNYKSNFQKRKILQFTGKTDLYSRDQILSYQTKDIEVIQSIKDSTSPPPTIAYVPTSPIILPTHKFLNLYKNRTHGFQMAHHSHLSSLKRKPYYPERVPQKVTKKIFFRDGASPNITITNSYQMIRLYDIFGPSIYYLSQSKARGLMWKYHTVRSTCKTDGNLLLSEKVALGIVNKYMKAVQVKYGNKYSLQRILNVEENHDALHGDRYLIELDLKEQEKGKIYRLSRYIYRDIKTDKLHEPQGFQWNPKTRVHIIVPVKDQGRWVQYLINNMEKIYLETQDVNLNLIIVDFNSSDIDIKRSLNNSKLVNYDVIELDGPFQRALGLQAGADKVKNADDIIFTCDLHLEIPTQLINSIRKHTIKGKMAFAPMVHRLSCGYNPKLPYGLWEIEGYGLFAISKYDFDRIGGMNTKEFKTKWGGEDWELLDRTLAQGIEVERMRIPFFHHYYHSKKRMWLVPKASAQPLNERSFTYL